MTAPADAIGIPTDVDHDAANKVADAIIRRTYDAREDLEATQGRGLSPAELAMLFLDREIQSTVGEIVFTITEGADFATARDCVAAFGVGRDTGKRVAIAAHALGTITGETFPNSLAAIVVASMGAEGADKLTRERWAAQVDAALDYVASMVEEASIGLALLG